MKRVVILGSSGSIGENALRVIESLPAMFKVTGLAVDRDYVRALQQAEQFGVGHIAVANEAMASECAKQSHGIVVHAGATGVEELAAADDVDIVLCAVVGMAGLRPVLAAVTHGTDVALATKEVLVSAGAIVMRACAEHGANLLPVDSEHSAILQCLTGAGDGTWSATRIKKLILTASGGPFSKKSHVDLSKVTVAEALDHPNWDMGKKVTIDSATLMNKGLEIMEAQWLFGIGAEHIEVIIHGESIVHSMVEFVDGSVVAQMSVPDMRFAIQYALAYPERIDGGLPGLDLTSIGSLQFEMPDENRFPCLRLAREAIHQGGTMPAVLSAANEIAVDKFLAGAISFSGIWETVEDVMSKHDIVIDPGLDEVIDADSWARTMCG